MKTTYFIGVDEAGYGPNLGPLVVAATLWQVDEPEEAIGSAPGNRRTAPVAGDRQWEQWDLYAALADRVSVAPCEDRVAIADSKALYSPAAGLTVLEESVLASLRACDLQPASWTALVQLLQADPDGDGHALPWHRAWDTPLPVAACPDRVERQTQRLLRSPDRRTRAAKSGRRVTLRDVQACAVHPAEFNRLTHESGTKSTALSRITLRLLNRTLQRLCAAYGDDLSAVAVCDKHGGRNHYAALLADALDQPLVQVETESRAISRYRLQLNSLSVEVAFQRSGEAFLPTALASMTAKYVRELSMRAFNAFWCERVSGLRPTAGYPADSRRFKIAIAEVQAALGIEDHVLWRSR